MTTEAMRRRAHRRRSRSQSRSVWFRWAVEDHRYIAYTHSAIDDDCWPALTDVEYSSRHSVDHLRCRRQLQLQLRRKASQLHCHERTV